MNKPKDLLVEIEGIIDNGVASIINVVKESMPKMDYSKGEIDLKMSGFSQIILKLIKRERIKAVIERLENINIIADNNSLFCFHCRTAFPKEMFKGFDIRCKNCGQVLHTNTSLFYADNEVEIEQLQRQLEEGGDE